MNPIDRVRDLENAIRLLLADEMVEVEEGSLKVTADGIATFRVNLTPESLGIVPLKLIDFDQEKFDSIFQELTEDF